MMPMSLHEGPSETFLDKMFWIYDLRSPLQKLNFN